MYAGFWAVKGHEQDGQFVAPFTTFAGAFGRATREEPFKLPASWLKAQQAGIDVGTQLDMPRQTTLQGTILDPR